MLAFTVAEPNVKMFMQHLFKFETFNDFEIRGVEIHGFTYFEISGLLLLSVEKADIPQNRSYCTWARLCPYVHDIIRGGHKPRCMKIIFARSEPETLHPNAAALFLNMVYENDMITLTTATAQKNFTLDKQMDGMWEKWAGNFFESHKIPVTAE